MKASVDSARPSECRFCEAQLPNRHPATTIRNFAVASSLSFAPKSRRGRRPQARATSRASAFLEVPPGHSLSRIAGYRWLCRNQPAQPGTLTFRFTHFPLLRCAPQCKKRAAL